MNKTIIGTAIITALLTFFVTRQYFTPNDEIHDENHAEDNHESEMNFSQELMDEFGIVVDTASGGNLERTIELPGEIKIDPDRLAHITPRFDGVVQKVFKQIGDRVKKDDLLAIIESNESLTTYELRSSIEGIVIDMHFTKGETAQRPDHFFAVADLSEVWVNLSIYQKYLSQIEIEQTVNVIYNSENHSVKGQISYISPTLDERTRTATARVIINNAEFKFRPGQFITGEVIVDNTYCNIVVPKTALETVDDKPVVFTVDEHGIEPKSVTFGKKNHKNVEIISGLTLGQSYVKKGAFVLKAEFGKESFGGGHNH